MEGQGANSSAVQACRPAAVRTAHACATWGRAFRLPASYIASQLSKVLARAPKEHRGGCVHPSPATLFYEARRAAAERHIVWAAGELLASGSVAQAMVLLWRRRRRRRLHARPCARPPPVGPLLLDLQARSSSQRPGGSMLSSLRLGTPAALWAARHGLAARPAAVSRVPLRCLAAKGGRKKDAEESACCGRVGLGPAAGGTYRAWLASTQPALPGPAGRLISPCLLPPPRCTHATRRRVQQDGQPAADCV